ncbi:MAG: SHOCT domain-containing protein [Anaerolineaceae bacterium]
MDFLMIAGISVVLFFAGIIFVFFMTKNNTTSKESIDLIQNKLKSDGFIVSESNISCKFINSGKLYKEFIVDSINHQLAIIDFNLCEVDILNFIKILDCKIIEDKSTIVQGGIGRAIVGGLIAGGIGAIVGASTRSSNNVISSLQVQIIIDDLSKPQKIIELITNQTKRDSLLYKNALSFANELYSTLLIIIEKNNPTRATYSQVEIIDYPEQIIKLADLREKGLITEEEFQLKKQQLLSRM